VIGASPAFIILISVILAIIGNAKQLIRKEFRLNTSRVRVLLGKPFPIIQNPSANC
jgi:hypothetical protein